MAIIAISREKKQKKKIIIELITHIMYLHICVFCYAWKDMCPSLLLINPKRYNAHNRRMRSETKRIFCFVFYFPSWNFQFRLSIHARKCNISQKCHRLRNEWRKKKMVARICVCFFFPSCIKPQKTVKFHRIGKKQWTK